MVGTEDCLRLNVFTRDLPVTENQTKKAVMVWLHGGLTYRVTHLVGQLKPPIDLDLRCSAILLKGAPELRFLPS